MIPVRDLEGTGANGNLGLWLTTKTLISNNPRRISEHCPSDLVNHVKMGFTVSRTGLNRGQNVGD